MFVSKVLLKMDSLFEIFVTNVTESVRWIFDGFLGVLLNNVTLPHNVVGEHLGTQVATETFWQDLFHDDEGLD
jgi:hypothetical protein